MQQAACSTQDGTQSATHNMRDMARLHNTYGAMSRQRRNVTGCIMLDWTRRRTACSPSQRTSWLSEMIKLPWLSMNGGMNGCRRGRSVLTPNRDRISVNFRLCATPPKHTQAHPTPPASAQSQLFSCDSAQCQRPLQMSCHSACSMRVVRGKSHAVFVCCIAVWCTLYL